MDGSSGPSTVIRSLWFVLFVAAFQAAFAVSGTVSVHHGAGFAKLDSGQCAAAVKELLAAREEGDSSNSVMLGLSRALECDNRLVDALSATFADNKEDTTGRIDLLLFRAQLLRKVGLEDEAVKVEREVGKAVVSSDSKSGLGDESLDPWIWAFSGNVQAGWIYEGDAVRKADSIEYYSEKAKGSVEEISTILPDSFVIKGEQLPLAGSLQFDAMKGLFTYGAAVPAQVVLPRSMDRWLVASGGIRLSASAQWTGWLGTDIAASANRTWYPVSGSSPAHRSEFSGHLSNRIQLGDNSISQSNVLSKSLGYSDEFQGYSGAHSLNLSRKLPWKASLSGSLGLAWFWNGSDNEVVNLPTTVVMVENARIGQATQKDTTLHFLDTAGKRIDPARLNPVSGSGLLAAGLVPGQWKSYSSVAFPIQVAAGFRRWNLGISIGQKPTTKLSLSAGIDLARTGWDSPYPGTYQDVDVVVQGLVDKGAVYFYKDALTGKEYWVKTPVNSRLSLLLFRVGPRVDWTTTASLAATYSVFKGVGVSAGWTAVVNRSNLTAYVAGASYTRNIWNSSASVGW